jgi:hypothetical protein
MHLPTTVNPIQLIKLHETTKLAVMLLKKIFWLWDEEEEKGRGKEI